MKKEVPEYIKTRVKELVGTCAIPSPPPPQQPYHQYRG